MGNIGETLGTLQSAMRELAAADYAEMPAATLGEVLLALERADASGAVARGRALNAFDAKDGHEDDGQRTAGAWLVNRAQVTKEEARAYRALGNMIAAHPLIAEAMSEALNDGSPVMSKSRARKVCSITSQIPEPHRQEADQIVVTAARAGAQLRDLVHIAAEILARTATPDTDDKPFTDRGLRLELTLDGAGVLTGDLSPECAAAVQAVLGELSKRSGKDDHRLQHERYHDALLEAMTRLLGSNLAPKKNGHPVTGIVHINLADMLAREDGSVLLREWTARMAARWAGYKAAASVNGGDGGAWLAGPPAGGLTCDAALFAIVTGDPDLDALDEMVRLCVQLGEYQHHAAETDQAQAQDQDAGREPDPRAVELMQRIIGQAVKLLSGEAGLASYLRRNLFGGIGLGGRSLPLDVGDSDEIPWWLRRAVTARDQGCRWPGGCDQPAPATQPHHVAHREHHGPTSLANLLSLCWYHHHVVVHRMGWTVKLHGDGTTEAVSPSGRVISEQSRPPPTRPG